MKKEFDILYDEIVKQSKDKLSELWERSRAEIKKANHIFVVIAIIVDIIIVGFYVSLISIFYKQVGSSAFFTIFALIFSMGIFDLMIYVFTRLIFSKNNNLYNESYKELVINELLKNFFGQVDYIPKKQMPRDIYKEANYKEYYDRYSSDDYMEGKIDDKYDITMAEIHTEREETDTDSDGHTTTHYVTVFHGLFAKIKLDKSIKNNLAIKLNYSVSKHDRLDMDSQEFEKYFDVYSEDKIKGMQLLTHDFMELLVQLRKVLGNKPFDICIYDNMLYVRIHSYSMFEAKISKNTIIDKTKLQDYYTILDILTTLIKSIIKEIDELEV